MTSDVTQNQLIGVMSKYGTNPINYILTALLSTEPGKQWPKELTTDLEELTTSEQESRGKFNIYLGLLFGMWIFIKTCKMYYLSLHSDLFSKKMEIFG